MQNGKEEFEKIIKDYYEQDEVKKYINADNEYSLSFISAVICVWLTFVAFGITLFDFSILQICLLSSLVVTLSTAIWSIWFLKKIKRIKANNEIIRNITNDKEE